MAFGPSSTRSQSDLRANNLRPKLKQLSVVLTTVDTAEQGVGRAECTEAIGDAYANGAVGHDTAFPCLKSHTLNQRKEAQPLRLSFFLFLVGEFFMGFEPSNR